MRKVIERARDVSDGAADEDAAAEVWAMLGDLVLDNERRREVSDALGMPFGRVRALRRIALRPMSMGELATTSGMDAPYTTIVVDDFERQGLVERRPHPTDRRAKVVVATRRGKAAARRAEAILGRPPAELALLDAADMRDLARILRKVTAGSRPPETRGPRHEERWR